MKLLQKLLFLAIILTTAFSCTNDDVVIDDLDFTATDWTTSTHSNDVSPNFDEVFEDNTVKRIDLVISSDNWNAMLEDMEDLYGTFGTGNSGPNSFAEEEPIYVPGSVFYNDIEWYKVGLRFKGNSSLASSWKNSIMKLSFKLDFDQYEDDYPQIDNQRFYGFKQLNLKNNYADKSMMREKVASDVFRNAGLVGPHTAFYTVYVDYGEGPIYFGLYTMVEEVDDSVPEDQFGDESGNLYKPDGDAATFATGTFNEEEYVKQNNEDAGDFSDVQNLLTAINDGTRTTDAATWRTNLETVFDTDVFLKYLAVNTTIQNWDTYGRMTHNYFLYNNPATGQLTWIPWDNNEALQDGKQGGSYALDFSGLNAASWPIIGYMYQDDVYKAKYEEYLQEVIDGAFNVSTIQALYASYSTLLEPYATSELDGYTFLNSDTEFQSAVSTLNSHVSQRTSAVNTYLD